MLLLCFELNLLKKKKKTHFVQPQLNLNNKRAARVTEAWILPLWLNELFYLLLTLKSVSLLPTCLPPTKKKIHLKLHIYFLFNLAPERKVWKIWVEKWHFQSQLYNSVKDSIVLQPESPSFFFKLFPKPSSILSTLVLEPVKILSTDLH